MQNTAKHTGQKGVRNAARNTVRDATSGKAASGEAERAARRRRNIALAVALVLAVLAAFAATQAFGASTTAASAVVRDANGAEQTLSLDTDTVVDVSTDAGWNRVVVENGTVRVEDADCPNHDCVDQGVISSAGQQIVCLPHQLIVSISDADSEAEYDVVGS